MIHTEKDFISKEKWEHKIQFSWPNKNPEENIEPFAQFPSSLTPKAAS